MAFTVTVPATQVDSTSNAASYSTASFSASVGDLIIAFVFSRGDNVDATSVTWGGLSLTQAQKRSQTADTHQEEYVGIVTSAGSNALTANFSPNKTGCHLRVVVISGADTSGTALNALQQSNHGGGTATSGSQGFVSGLTSGNMVVGAALHRANEATNLEAGWTAIGTSGNFNTPASSAAAGYRTDITDSTFGASWTTSSGFGILVSEVKAAAAWSATATAGAAAIAGTAPVFKTRFGQTAGAIAAAGVAPVFKAGLRPTAGALALAGAGPVFKAGLAVSTGTIAIEGVGPGLTQELKLFPPAGALALAGAAGFNTSFAHSAGAASIAGVGPGVRVAFGITAGEIALAAAAGYSSQWIITRGTLFFDPVIYTKLQIDQAVTAGALTIGATAPVLDVPFALSVTAGELVLSAAGPAKAGMSDGTEVSLTGAWYVRWRRQNTYSGRRRPMRRSRF